MFVDAAALPDVPSDRPAAADPGGRPVVLVRLSDTVCALQRRCPHKGADLAKGTVRDGVLVCPRHAAAFDLATGRAAGPPRFLFLTMRTGPALSYPVRVEAGRVLVDIG